MNLEKAGYWATIITNIPYAIVGYFGDYITFIGGILLCVGSSLMHYTYNSTTNKLDWGSMYIYFFAIFVFVLPLAIPQASLIFLVLCGLSILSADVVTSNRAAIGLVVIMTGVVSYALGGNFAIHGMILFSIALAIREWGHTKSLVVRHWTHSLWHVLTAIASYLYIL